MDAIADQLNVQVGQNDLTERLVLMSRQYGLEPQQLLQYLQENNQAAGDVRRRPSRLTVAAVVHGATVVDTAGTVIDTTEFFGPPATTDFGRSRGANRGADQAAGGESAEADAEADAEPEQADDDAEDEASADTVML